MSLEPWYELAHAALRPPVQLWFRWHYEGVERIPRHGPVVVAANHISYLDPIAHALLLVRVGRRPRFLAKEELFRAPFVGAVMRGAGQISVSRGSGSHEPLQSAIDAVRAGECVVVYPEATVTGNPDFTPMKGKTGIARLALGAGAPVLPIAIWGSAPVWQRGGRRNLKFGRPIWLKVGEPIDLSSYGDPGRNPTVSRRATDAIMAELGRMVSDLRARYPSRWS